MQKYFYNRGQSLIGIIIVLIVVGLIGGGLYYYLQKQIPEVPEITKKPAEEVVTPEESAVTPPEEELPKEEIEAEKPKIEKPEITKPEVEIVARPAEISNKNSPISTVFGIMVALAQEFKTGKELQVEIRDAPPKELKYPETLTWTVTYGIKNITDSLFVLAYDIKPDVYKTGGAVVVDPDGDGPEKSFYYTFGEEVLLQPRSEQHFYLSLTPPKGLTTITPRIVFKGFSTEEPLFVHEFTVKVIYIPPPAECETPTCPQESPQETIIYWNGGVDNYKCPILQCVSPESKPIPEPCESITTTAEGLTIVEKCENCAIISPKGVCAESTSMQCTWNLPPERWTMVDKCPD